MKKNTFLLSFVFACLTAGAQTQRTDYVNPFIGTEGMGHTFPGACAPFGIVQLSPETDTIPHNVNGHYQGKVYEYCAGYQHTDNTIVGFSHTHLSGTGHSDLGDILVMPQTGALQLNPGTRDNPDGGYRQRFSHGTEIARPGYYEVTLADNGEGMTNEVKQRLYENFFTTKPIGSGTGLGMAITRDIIEKKHGGKLSFESTEGIGTTFTFTIPIRK